MLNAEDRKIRVVDYSLEILAQALGQAVTSRNPGVPVEDLIAQCLKGKAYQGELFSTAINDPSTMLNLAIAHAGPLGVDDGELHQLRKFRNAVVHKHQSASARQVALDAGRVSDEINRAAVVLERIGQGESGKRLRRHLHYYLAGAPDPWVPDDEIPETPPVTVKPTSRKAKGRAKVIVSKGGLSDDQADAVERAKRWWAGAGKRFVITGSAGTGKTRLVTEILAALSLTAREVRIVAPTNKACDVLRSKLPPNLGFRGAVSTFHSLLFRYQYPPQPDGEDFKWVVVGTKPTLPDVRLLVCDEASMLADLDVEAMEAKYRTIYFGDPAQLPPVLEGRESNGRSARASDVLAHPDAVLTTIHRQAGGSSILEAADVVRSGEFLDACLWDDQATQVLHESEGHVDRSSFRQLLRDSDAVLVARNTTRIRVNQIIRELRGYVTFPGDWLPKPGELLVSSDKISESDSSFRGQPAISNGQQLVVERVVRVAETTKRSTGQPVEFVEVEAHFRDDPSIRGRWPISQEMLLGKHVVGDQVSTKGLAGPRSGILRCDWAYALTVHKAQGSEWARVGVVDHGAYDKIGAREWNYVALTRASKTVSVVRLNPDSALLA